MAEEEQMEPECSLFTMLLRSSALDHFVVVKMGRLGTQQEGMTTLVIAILDNFIVCISAMMKPAARSFDPAKMSWIGRKIPKVYILIEMNIAKFCISTHNVHNICRCRSSHQYDMGGQ